jgi:nucleoside 2-deoxyribosyltransferase
MKAKICLCSSRRFFDKLEEIGGRLKNLGFDVFFPSMRNIQDDFLLSNKDETAFAKIHYNLIKNHFKKIDESDAVLICNFDKDEIKGYIGGNTLMEMAKAFDKGISIFLLNPIPEINYRAEIIAMQPIILKNLEEIKNYLKK